jgi:hypothetical protein
MASVLHFLRLRPKASAVLAVGFFGAALWLCKVIGLGGGEQAAARQLVCLFSSNYYSGESLDRELSALSVQLAVPALIRVIEQEDSAWKDRYEGWYAKAPQRLKRFLPVPRNRQRVVRTALRALGRFGPEAAPAVPMLARHYERSVAGLPKAAPFRPAAASAAIDPQGIASALGSIGLAATSAIPALLVSLEPASGYIGSIATDTLLRIDPTGDYTDQALAVLERDNRYAGLAATIASNCVAELTRGVRPASAPGSWQALEAASCVRSEASRTVPTLICVLHHENERYRAKAAESLGRLGVAARDAVPQIRILLGDEWSMVRQAATNALIAIAGGRP